MDAACRSQLLRHLEAVRRARLGDGLVDCYVLLRRVLDPLERAVFLPLEGFNRVDDAVPRLTYAGNDRRKCAEIVVSSAASSRFLILGLVGLMLSATKCLSGVSRALFCGSRIRGCLTRMSMEAGSPS